MTLRINEIYCSILGESTFAGIPCALVRLTGCNLRCTYCDTKYAYENGIEMSVEQIIRSVMKFDVAPVLITGGEPLLQDGVMELINRLLDAGHLVLLETNGSLDIKEIPGDVITIMDVKCPGSGEDKRVHYDNLDYVSEADNVKFVISDYEDYLWSRNLIDDYDLTMQCPVLMTPVIGKVDPADLSKWMIADKLFARLSLQIHKVIWGNDVQGR